MLIYCFLKLMRKSVSFIFHKLLLIFSLFMKKSITLNKNEGEAIGCGFKFVGKN